MKQERTLSIEGKEYTLLISDEPQALLEAKASGSFCLQKGLKGCFRLSGYGKWGGSEQRFSGDPLCSSLNGICDRRTFRTDPAPVSGTSVAY